MLPLALAILPSLYQMGKSVEQRSQAKNLKQSGYVPPSIENAVANARLNAGATQAPGYDQALSNLKTSTANNILNAKKTASNAAQLSATAAEGDAREKQGLQSLSTSNQQFRFNNRQDLMKWLGIRGQSEQNNYNQFNAAKSALIGASNNNMYNGLTGLVSAGLTAADKDPLAAGGTTLGGQPASNTVLGAAGKPTNSVLGAAGNGSVLGKTGIDLAKAIRNRNGSTFDDNEAAYLKSLGYSVGPGGQIFNNNSPDFEVFQSMQ